MDYAALTDLRSAMEKVSRQRRPSGPTLAQLRRSASTLGAATTKHELQHLPAGTRRLKVARHLPSDHIATLLQTPALDPPPSAVKRNATSSPQLAAAFAVLLAALQPHVAAEDLRPLQHSYHRVVALAPDAARLPTQLATLSEQVRTAVTAMNAAVALVTHEADLSSVEETLDEHWTAVRAAATSALELVPLAERFALHYEAWYLHGALQEARLLHQRLFNRELVLPPIDMPIGAARRRQRSSHVDGDHTDDPSGQRNDSDDGDDDDGDGSEEWEDAVEMVHSEASEPESPAPESAGTPSLETEMANHTAKETQSVNLSPVDDWLLVLRGNNARNHNDNVLKALAPVATTTEEQEETDYRAAPSRRPKKKQPTVRDRLRKKLGIKKSKKRSLTDI